MFHLRANKLQHTNQFRLKKRKSSLTKKKKHQHIRSRAVTTVASIWLQAGPGEDTEKPCNNSRAEAAEKNYFLVFDTKHYFTTLMHECTFCLSKENKKEKNTENAYAMNSLHRNCMIQHKLHERLWNLMLWILFFVSSRPGCSCSWAMAVPHGTTR